MSRAALIIFAVTYLGVALGRLPGLALDRTGMALLGGIAMVVAGVLSEREALLAVDFPTVGLLYALMVLSAQLRLGGFYTRVALAVARLMDRPGRFLLILMAVSAALSALLVNDIICLAFTPVLAVSLLRSGLNPGPFLIGLAVSSNIGSAATIIGNPQNMLIGQVGRLHFGRFLLWCGPPSVLALLAAYLVIAWLYRGRWRSPAAGSATPSPEEPEFNPHQTQKGLAATIILVGLFFTPIPRELSAMAVAGVLLCSRKMQTRWILDLVDWHLITLFAGLFVVIRGVEAAGLPGQMLAFLQGRGVDLRSPGTLTLVSAGLSNLVSNVPATMLLMKFMDPADPAPWYVMALAMTYAGNLLTIGSIANLIVIEQAKPYGIHIGFREHARTGIPVTIVSLLITVGWIWWRAG